VPCSFVRDPDRRPRPLPRKSPPSVRNFGPAAPGQASRVSASATNCTREKTEHSKTPACRDEGSAAGPLLAGHRSYSGLAR
jgi:hypothetical protein